MYNKYFFDKGLRFTCQRCGKCCTGEPGTVLVSSSELVQIATFLGMSNAAFKREFLYPYKGQYSIKEDDQGNCLFFAQGCQIYPVRPQQCRSYPFWFKLLRSETRWEQEARQCPGIGQGKLYSKEEILELVAESVL